MRKGRQRIEHQEPREVYPCAHTGCPEPAIMRRDIRGKEAKLCKKHDLFHVQQESNEFCRNNSLETYEQKRDWILAKLASPRLTPAEHWTKVLETPNLIPHAYEMARNYFARHGITPNKPQSVPARSRVAAPDEETEAAFRAYLAETAIPEADSAQE